MKQMIVVTLSFAVSAVLAGTSYWTGDGGDGKWSTAANWSPSAPVAGDNVVLSNKTDDVLIIDNDADGTEVNQLSFATSSFGKRIELRGKKITVRANGIIQLCPDKPHVYAPIDCLGDFTLRGIEWATWGSTGGDFYGPITATNENGTMTFALGQTVYCYAPVHLGGFKGSYSTGAGGTLCLCAAGNTFRTFQPYYSHLDIDVDYGVTPDFVFDWGDFVQDDGSGKVYVGSHVQVVDHIGGPLSTDSTHNYQSGAAGYGRGRQLEARNGAVIIQRAKGSVTTEALLRGGEMTVVWAPLDVSYVQSFELRAHTMTGTLVASNGTMKVANGASFANVGTVTVCDGASFVLDTTAANALQAMSQLAVGKNGTFTASGNCVTPFGSAAVALRLKAGAKLVLGKDISFNAVAFVCGVSQPAGTYTANNCNWIEGDGSCVVTEGADVVSWASATDGEWSDGAKWTSKAAPDGTKEVYITAEGADYAVTLDRSAVSFPSLYLENDGFTSTLRVANDATFSADSVIIAQAGGVYEQVGGQVSMSSSAKQTSVENGGVWRVYGGTNTVINTGIRPFVVKAGGLLDVNGATFLAQNSTAAAYLPPFSMLGGSLVVRGAGYFESRPTSRAALGFGTVEVKDMAKIKLGSQSVDSASGTMRIKVRDRSVFEVSELSIGNNSSGYDGRIECLGTSTNSFGDLYVGANQPGYGEISVAVGASATMGINYYFNIGSCLNNNQAYSACFPTGVVTVAGLVTSRSECFQRAGLDNPGVLMGVEIGGTCHPMASDKTSVATRQQYWPVGTLNVEKTGTYLHPKGITAIGHGFGEGSVNVRGGTYAEHSEGLVMVGAGEGVGLFNVTEGGTVNIGKDLYVGSFVTNVTASWSIPRYWPTFPNDSLVSTGTVRVIDGSFALRNGDVKYDAVFGGQGTGVLEIGSNGLFTAGQVVFSNHVASVLKFTPGTNGSGMLSADRLTISPGARLVVDLTACDESTFRKQTLAEADVWSGEFSEANITIVPSGTKFAVRRVGNKLQISRNAGLMIIFR